jgi:hypothetical protein
MVVTHGNVGGVALSQASQRRSGAASGMLRLVRYRRSSHVRTTRFAAAEADRLSTSRIGGGWNERTNNPEIHDHEATQNETWTPGSGP